MKEIILMRSHMGNNPQKEVFIPVCDKSKTLVRLTGVKKSFNKKEIEIIEKLDIKVLFVDRNYKYKE